MSAHTAGLRVPRERARHIHELTNEIAARERLMSHLLMITGRAFYYFLTAACLTAGIILYANGRHTSGAVWGGVGVALVLAWIGVKVASWVLHRAFDAIRSELAEIRPGHHAEAEEPTPEATAPDTTAPVATVPVATAPEAAAPDAPTPDPAAPTTTAPAASAPGVGPLAAPPEPAEHPVRP